MKMFEEFQAFRRILCLCPCCGDIVRVSDLKLKVKGRVEKTWMDLFERREKLMGMREEKWEGVAAGIRAEAVERGRRASARVFSSCIHPGFKRLKLDPFDLQPVLHPIDFVVFKGMNRFKRVREVLLLSEVTRNVELRKLRSQVKRVVERGEVDWKTVRIGERGGVEVE